MSNQYSLPEESILKDESLFEVNVGTLIPKFFVDRNTNERKIISLTDVANYILDLDKDKDWWGFIDETLKLNNSIESNSPEEGTQWYQSLWLILNLEHEVGCLERSIDVEKGKAFMKTIAIPLKESRLKLSYIAEYTIVETEDGYLFNLNGKVDLPIPKLLSPIIGNALKLFSQYNLYKLRKVFSEGVFLQEV